MSANIIEKIDSLELHDSGIRELKVDFITKSVTLVYEKWNTKKKNYDEYSLIFQGVTKFETSKAYSNTLLMEEISEIQCQQKNQTEYNAEIILVADFGEPDWAINITFTDILITSDM